MRRRQDEPPRLALLDAAGEGRVNLAMTTEGPRLLLYDAWGKVIWRAP